MGNRLSYYFSQGIKNLKGSILIILGLSLALSMVSGINFYIDAYQDNLMNESFDQIIDFDASFPYNNVNFSDYFQNSEATIISTVQDSEILEIESFSRYALFSSQELMFYKNYSNTPQQYRGGRQVIETVPLYAGLFDEEFYDSKRFDQYFSIIEGEYPSSENEMLIPFDFAYKMNLTLGEIINLDVWIGYYIEENTSSNFFLPNMEIVGIYASKLEFYQFGYNYFHRYYEYDEGTNTVENYEPLRSSGLEMILCYNNFSKFENNHPIQNLYTEIDLFLKANIGEDQYYYFIEISSGIAFFYDRDLIDFNHINSFYRKISQETQIIERQLDTENGNIYFTDYLSYHLSSLYFISNILRIVLQLLNVPILIFAIFIGSFAIKTNAKTRLDEFLLLRSKGAPTKLLRNQFFIEALFIGVASSIIALIAGLGTFFGFRELLGDIFFGLTPAVELSPSISWNTVIITMGFGVGITFIATFSSISYVGKLPINKLLKILGADSMDVEYDEKTLFSDPKTKKTSIEETPFYHSSQENNAQLITSQDLKEKREESSEGFLSKLKKKITLQKQKKHALYQNVIKVKEGKGAGLSIALIVISSFPLILYLIQLSGSLPRAPDILISVSEFIIQNFGLILIGAIFSPILLVVGIIRIIVVERPSRFARISKFLSSILLKDRSYICGMEMVRRKQYKTVIFLVGIFTSLLIFSNVFLNSFYRYNIIYRNWDIGSDVKASFNFENMNITNTADIELQETQLKAYRTIDNQTLINDVLTCYSEITSYTHQRLSYFNIEKYLRIIQEDGKILPTKHFISDIQEVIDYNKNQSNTIPGVIVNNAFLRINKLDVGDLYSITHHYYNSVSMEMENQTIDVKIILETGIMPGIYFAPYQWGSEKIIIDLNSINQDKTLLHGLDIFQMIDINPALETDLEVLEEMVLNASSGYVDYTDFEFYDQNWNSLTYEMNLGESGLYGILYLEFIIIGILLAFGLSILILSLQKENKYFNGVLLARGLGRSGLLKMVLSQMSIIFLIGISTGVLSGLFTSISFVKIAVSLDFGVNVVSLPIYANFLELFGILGIIVVSSFVIFLIAYYFESRKNITEYFHKF